MLTIEQIKTAIANNDGCGIFKYVRVGNEFRFTDIMSEHKSLVKDGEKAFSGAMLRIKFNAIRVTDYSMSLNIGPSIDDEELLSKLFDMPVFE